MNWRQYDINVWESRASVGRGDFSVSSFPPKRVFCHPLVTSQGAPKGRMGSRLYSGIIYYKWRHSQGRHYQTLAPSRIPTAPVTVPLRSPRPLSIHSARGLSIRTAELLCRLIDSLSERCEVRYSTWYRFNFMPIISVQREANRAEGGGQEEDEYSRYATLQFPLSG